MSLASIDLALPDKERILLDSTNLIAYFDKTEPVSPVATYIIDELVHSVRNYCTVSIVTVMEVLVRPLKEGARRPYQHIMDFLSNFPNLRALNIDLHIAQEAALSLTTSFEPPRHH